MARHGTDCSKSRQSHIWKPRKHNTEDLAAQLLYCLYFPCKGSTKLPQHGTEHHDVCFSSALASMEGSCVSPEL